MNITPWLLTALSIIGVVLNIQKKRASYAIWILTNAGWLIIDLRAGLYAQAALFAVYWVLSVWGFIKWGEKCST